EEIAHVGSGREVGADALPQVIERAQALKARLDEAAAKLERLRQARAQALAIGEEAMRIQTVGAALLEQLLRLADAVGARDLQLGIVPQHDVAVIRVEGVDAAPLARPLADLAERDLAQAAELAQHRAIGNRVEQDDFLAVGGVAENAAALQLTPQREPVF